MASWTPFVIALLAESIATKKTVATMPSPPLLPMRRIVTAHDDQGKGVVARDSQICTEILLHVAGSVNIWSSDTSPADVVSSEDKGLAETGFVNNGSIFRIVDLPPRSIGALHRSISLDYIIVQQGQVVLSLDDGSKTRLRAGDVVVQQATMHGWDNETDERARFLAIMLPAVAPVVGGKEMQTDLAALFESG